MEPSSNAEYSKQEYWDKRYTEEEHYDWFPSVYPACVAASFDAIEGVHQARTASSSSLTSADQTVTVLHLGTGNSALCADIRAAYETRYPEGVSRFGADDVGGAVLPPALHDKERTSHV